jgi:hypothetical protein
MKCSIQLPANFCDQLSATLDVTLLEDPSKPPVDIIDSTQDYIVRVDVELGSQIKKLICGEWKIRVAVEGLGTAKEFDVRRIIPMDNCNPAPDRTDIRIHGSDFGVAPGDSGVFYIVVSVMALNSCDHKPIGIAGFCKLGPVMVFN